MYSDHEPGATGTVQITVHGVDLDDLSDALEGTTLIEYYSEPIYRQHVEDLGVDIDDVSVAVANSDKTVSGDA